MAAAVFLHPHMEGHQSGPAALLVYVIIYLFMNLGAFGVTALVLWDTGSDDMDSFVGLARRSPWLAVPMTICLVSLVGLPPLAGFLGKWWILVALGSLNSTLGWFLVIVAVVNTLISLYYYMRIIVVMTIRDTGKPVVHSPISGLALVNVCAAMLLAMFFFAAPLKSTADRFTQHLYAAAVSTAENSKTLAFAQDHSN